MRKSVACESVKGPDTEAHLEGVRPGRAPQQGPCLGEGGFLLSTRLEGRKPGPRPKMSPLEPPLLILTTWSSTWLSPLAVIPDTQNLLPPRPAECPHTAWAGSCLPKGREQLHPTISRKQIPYTLPGSRGPRHKNSQPSCPSCKKVSRAPKQAATGHTAGPRPGLLFF